MLQDLESKELLEINGGSEITDSIWYGIGWAVGYAGQMAEIISDGMKPNPWGTWR